MGSTEEQIQFLANGHVTHVAYILILYSITFILYLCEFFVFCTTLPFVDPSNKQSVANILLHIYAVHTWPDTANPPSSGEIDRGYPKPYHTRSSTIFSRNNALRPNGHARTSSEAQRIQDAEAFELQGLISDEENEAAGAANGPGPMTTIDEEHPLAVKGEERQGDR